MADSSSLSPADHDKNFAAVIGTNLRRYRSQSNLSLEKLSRAAGVSRAMLGQIELGKSVPSITVLARIAGAFELPVTAFIGQHSDPGVTLLRAVDTKVLGTADGAFVSRALFPFNGSRKVEFYELRLRPGCNHSSDPHPSGTYENLVVTHGALLLSIGADVHALDTGDAIFFAADAPHSYRNENSEPAVAYLVMSYAESINY